MKPGAYTGSYTQLHFLLDKFYNIVLNMDNKSILAKYQRVIFEKAAKTEDIEKQITLMFFYIFELNRNINNVINNYMFFVKDFIYHQKKYFNYLQEIITNLLNMEFINNIKDISISENQIEPLSFELECIIIKYYRLLQKPIKDQFITFFENSIRKEFINLFPKSNSIDSFYLRIKILRDNIIHMIDTKFININDVIAQLYFENSAKILNVLHFNNDQLKLYNTLLDIRHNDNLKNHIARHLKNGNLKKRISETIKPNSGFGQTENERKIFLESTIAGTNMIVFDCFNHYFELFEDMYYYLFELNRLIVKQIFKSNKERAAELIKVKTIFKENEISYKNIFGNEKCNFA
jgi:hypothetical protein